LAKQLKPVNLPGFIASRMLHQGESARMSRPIVRIATTGVAVGMVLMLVSMAIVRGFQREIRDKVIGFGSHIQVTQVAEGRTQESARMLAEPEVAEAIRAVPGVSHVQSFAVKPGILETASGLQGVVVKGAGPDFDWSYLQSSLEEGSVLSRDSSGMPQKHIMLSRYIADRLHTGIGEKVSLYFINSESDARQQNFLVTGIYRTDLEDFDHQYVFTELAFIQKYSGWGLDAQILADTSCTGGLMAIGALGFGGDGDYTFTWPEQDWTGEGPHYAEPCTDTSFMVVVSDQKGTTPDTATLVVDFRDDLSREPCRSFTTSIVEGVPSEQSYTGGYEVSLNDYDLLADGERLITEALPFYLTATGVTSRNPDIFAWLEMLDLNVYIIILLMIVISIINMTSALLIIILERQRMIGSLKAFGMANGPVIGIFLYHAAFIIGRGLFWGNVAGLALLALQHYTGFVQLDPVNYYVSKVPVWIDGWTVVALNLGTLIICLVALLLPALYTTRITPIRSIRFS
jgi:lipoprotein-releasing system permease protein